MADGTKSITKQSTVLVGDILYSFSEPKKYTDLTPLVQVMETAAHGRKFERVTQTYDFAKQKFRDSKPPVPPCRQLNLSDKQIETLGNYKRLDYDKIFVNIGKEAGVAIDLKTNRIFVYDPQQTQDPAIKKVISELKSKYNPWFFNRIEVIKNNNKQTESVDKFRKFFFKTPMDRADIFFNQEAFIPTYADGNCAMNMFGEVKDGRYRWTDGNPREKLMEAIENLPEDAKEYYNEALENYLIETAYEKTEEDYLTHMSSSSYYLNNSEIRLFAYLVAKKNYHIEGQTHPIDLGFDETIHVRFIENKDNPRLNHWERVS